MNYRVSLFPLEMSELPYEDAFGSHCVAYFLRNREDELWKAEQLLVFGRL